MTEDLVYETKYTLQVRSRGQVTIPRKLREALAIDEGDTLTVLQVGDGILLMPKPLRTAELANKIADMMEEEGVALADLLENLPRIREEIYQERYGTSPA